MSTDNRWLDLHMKRQYDAAVADRTEAIRRDPDDAWAFADRGESHRMKGELDRAIADFSEAIRLTSTEYMFFARRGEAHRLKGDYERAVADCTQAIRLNPNDFWALSIRAVCYRGQGNLARAAEDFDRAVRLNPSDPWILAHRGDDTRRRIGYIENGNATLRHRGKGGDPSGFLKTDDYDKAIADLAESLRLKPDQPQALNWLVAAHIARGRTLRELRQFDRAIADCTDAIRLDPKNAEAFAVRGDVRWWRNEYDLATADLDEAIRLDPKKDYKDLLDKVRRSVRSAKAKDTAPSRVEPRAVQNASVKTSIQTTAFSPSSCDPGVVTVHAP